jgi:sulfur-oxidizing protein SoxY
MKRREFIQAGAATVAGTALGARAQGLGLAAAQDIKPLIDKITGGKQPERRDVEIEIPQLAENGNSVPATIRVKSPMTPEDHVSAIHVLAERNPRPEVATFHLGPQSGKAEIATRIRLAGSQNVTVVAVLSGDRYRIADAPIVVTAAACLDETAG